MDKAFNSNRRPSLNVYILRAKLPLVRTHGPAINTHELREDFYDLEANLLSRAGANSIDATSSVHGEPYARWF